MVQPSKEPAYVKEYRRQYYLKNKDREQAYAKTWHEANTEKVKQLWRDYISKPEAYYKSRHSNTLRRAKKYNLEFDLTVDDITQLLNVTRCPLLGTPLRVAHENPGNGLLPDAPSLDRIDPAKGYVKDNVWCISAKANSIKNSATWQELYQIALNLKTKIESMEDAATESSIPAE